MNVPAVSIQDLTVSYRHSCALSHVTLEVQQGDFLGIIGPNGGGKSTLLKTVLGLLTPDSGTVSILGEPAKDGRSCIGYVPQHNDLSRQFPITVQQVPLTAFLKKGLHPFHRYSVAEREGARQALQRVGLENLAQRQLAELSGGQFQRLLIARALAAQPKILLLDEPTASIDPASTAQIYSLLAELNKDITIILVTHDLMAIASEVRHLACLNQNLVYHGTPQLTEDIVHKMYGCPIDLIAHGVPHRVLCRHQEEDHA